MLNGQQYRTIIASQCVPKPNQIILTIYNFQIIDIIATLILIGTYWSFQEYFFQSLSQRDLFQSRVDTYI